MAHENLEQMIAAAESPARLFRDMDLEHSIWEYPDDAFPDQFTNWIEEQRALRESCSIVDQSYHMQPLYIEGPDALAVYEDLGANNFENFRNGSAPQAKQLVLATPEGYTVRDTILFRTGEDEYVTLGAPVAQNWLQFNTERGDYDVTVRKPYSPIEKGDPPEFRFEVQGPDALNVLEDATDGTLPHIPFFQMDTISIAGHEILAVGHGMADTPGLEVFGPYEHHDEVKDAILAAGEEYGIRELGSMGYKTTPLASGWIPMPVPGIYHGEEMRDYREWLGTDTVEANMAIGGSFDSDDITDYYMDPFERGHGRLIDLDRDFVGSEALRERKANQTRERVTFVWDAEDVIDVYASLFREGETHKFIDMPDPVRRWSKTHYDRVEIDGELVGLSKWMGYLYSEREMLSLGVMDTAHSDPGTEATLVWGEEHSKKRKVERHAETEIGVTVAPAPYGDRGKKDM